jgi:hypothetical protein
MQLNSLGSRAYGILKEMSVTSPTLGLSVLSSVAETMTVSSTMTTAFTFSGSGAPVVILAFSADLSVDGILHA